MLPCLCTIKRSIVKSVTRKKERIMYRGKVILMICMYCASAWVHAMEQHNSPEQRKFLIDIEKTAHQAYAVRNALQQCDTNIHNIADTLHKWNTYTQQIDTRLNNLITQEASANNFNMIYTMQHDIHKRTYAAMLCAEKIIYPHNNNQTRIKSTHRNDTLDAFAQKCMMYASLFERLNNISDWLSHKNINRLIRTCPCKKLDENTVEEYRQSAEKKTDTILQQLRNAFKKDEEDTYKKEITPFDTCLLTAEQLPNQLPEYIQHQCNKATYVTTQTALLLRAIHTLPINPTYIAPTEE